MQKRRWTRWWVRWGPAAVVCTCCAALPVALWYSAEQASVALHPRATSSAREDAQAPSGQCRPSEAWWQCLSRRTFEDPVAFWTLFLAGFTGTLVFISLRQFKYIRTADRTARLAADAARQSAEAAKASADAFCDLERAYVFLSHSEPVITNGKVSFWVQALNQGRTFGILKETRYVFKAELPEAPTDKEWEEWEWNILEHDWTIKSGERKNVVEVTSPLDGEHYFAGCITYQDAFTRKRHRSWTAIKFNPSETAANPSRGGGDPWNDWN